MTTIASCDINNSQNEVNGYPLDVKGKTVHSAKFFPYRNVQIVFTDGTILTIAETQQAGDIEVTTL